MCFGFTTQISSWPRSTQTFSHTAKFVLRPFLKSFGFGCGLCIIKDYLSQVIRQESRHLSPHLSLDAPCETSPEYSFTACLRNRWDIIVFLHLYCIASVTVWAERWAADCPGTTGPNPPSQSARRSSSWRSTTSGATPCQSSTRGSGSCRRPGAASPAATFSTSWPTRWGMRTLNSVFKLIKLIWHS